MMTLSRVQPVGEECFSSKCVKLKYVVGFRIGEFEYFGDSDELP